MLGNKRNVGLETESNRRWDDVVSGVGPNKLLSLKIRTGEAGVMTNVNP